MTDSHQPNFTGRLSALIFKEFRQIRRDRRVAISLILPPTLQLLLFGFALNATVSNLRLGLIDDCRTPESRELTSTMTESKSFQLSGVYLSLNEMSAAISRGDLDVGIVIPYDFARNLQRGRQSTIQILLNATNANTAAIGQGYAEGIIQIYNRGPAGHERLARAIYPPWLGRFNAPWKRATVAGIPLQPRFG